MWYIIHPYDAGELIFYHLCFLQFVTLLCGTWEGGDIVTEIIPNLWSVWRKGMINFPIIPGNCLIDPLRTNMATSSTISQLQDLDDLADDAFSNTFTCNLTTIFQYACNDIISSLEQRDLATLAALRSSLCELTQQNLDAYVDAVPVQQKVKHTTANDIFALGFCPVNKQRTNDSDKVFNIKHEASREVDINPEVTKLGKLVLVVIRLQKTVNNLESQVAELQTANSELQTRLDEHIASTPTTAGHPESVTPDQHAPSQLTAPPVDVAQPSQSTQLGGAQQQQHSSRRKQRYSCESDSSSLSSDWSIRLGGLHCDQTKEMKEA